MWLMIMLVLLGLALLAVYYLLTRFHRFSFVQELAAGHRALSWLVAFLPLALLGLFAAKNVTTLIIVREFDSKIARKTREGAWRLHFFVKGEKYNLHNVA